MPKPPKATPHSDLDGVREDKRRNIDTANEAEEDGADLAEAGKKSTGRPPYSDDQAAGDDRTG